MPATPNTDTEQPKGAWARLVQLALQALPAVAGAIGVVGFVALIGGAIQWVRFWSAGLPADQAVRVTPREELVTIGAVALIAFLILGLLAVLTLYLLDRDGDATVRTLRGLVILAVIEMGVTLAFVDLPLWENAVLAVGFVVAGLLSYFALEDVPARLRRARERALAGEALRAALAAFQAASDRYDDALLRVSLAGAPPPNGEPGPPEPEGAGPGGPGVASPGVERGLLLALTQAAVELRRAQREWRRALDRWAHAAPDEIEARRRRAAAEELKRDRPPTEDELRGALEPTEEKEPLRLRGVLNAARGLRLPKQVWDRRPRLTPQLAAGLAAAALLVGGAVFLATGDEEEILVVSLLVVVVILAFANFGVARATSRFAWYGVAAFVSLLVFGAALNIGRTIREPQVQPVALVRKGDDRPLCGVYVTETDKRVYVGRVQEDEDDGDTGADRGAGRMFWVPVGDVDVVSVGPFQNVDEAAWRAQELTAEVLADRPEKAPPAPKPVTKTTSVKKATNRKNGSLERATTKVAEIPVAPDRQVDEMEQAPPATMPCASVDLAEGRVKPALKPAARTTPSRPGP